MYADDFIITGASREVLEEKVIPVVTAFLRERGLELSTEKSKITHIDPYESGIVRLIFELAKCEKKPFEIARILNTQGLQRRNGSDWTRRQVVEILKRKELYSQGIFHYGEAQGKIKS